MLALPHRDVLVDTASELKSMGILRRTLFSLVDVFTRMRTDYPKRLVDNNSCRKIPPKILPGIQQVNNKRPLQHEAPLEILSNTLICLLHILLVGSCRWHDLTACKTGRTLATSQYHSMNRALVGAALPRRK